MIFLYFDRNGTVLNTTELYHTKPYTVLISNCRHADLYITLHCGQTYYHPCNKTRYSLMYENGYNYVDDSDNQQLRVLGSL